MNKYKNSLFSGILSILSKMLPAVTDEKALECFRKIHTRLMKRYGYR